MNCCNLRKIYYDKYNIDNIIPEPQFSSDISRVKKKNFVYTTQGILDDQTVFDRYSNQYREQKQCLADSRSRTYIKYAPFSSVKGDYIMDKIIVREDKPVPVQE